MPAHYESYKGWSISVQISAHLSRIDLDRPLPDYMPRIIVTEHAADGSFRDREVIDGHSYATQEQCLRHGIATAHDDIDGRTGGAMPGMRH